MDILIVHLRYTIVERIKAMEVVKQKRKVKPERVPVDKASCDLWDAESPLYKNKAIADVIGEDEGTVSVALKHKIATAEVKAKLNKFFKDRKPRVSKAA